MFRSFARSLLSRKNQRITKTERTLASGTGVYKGDLFMSCHNHDFMTDPEFQRAYQRGIQAAGKDRHRHHWRVHIGLWVAECAGRLDGDFVECGVNYGFLSSAIMEKLDWDRMDRNFYLVDTFHGLDSRFVSAAETERGYLERNGRLLESGVYVSGVESVRENFSEWKNVSIVQGAVPEILPEVAAERIAYLHLDMNCSYPEVMAAEYFWPRLVDGAFVLADDYGRPGLSPTKPVFDEFAAKKNVSVCSLPTGQGLIVKPPGG